MRSFLREPILRLVILGMLFVTALCLRLYGIQHPPMEFHTVRQYHGALLARGLYEWWLTGNLRTLPPDGIIEPPILEFIASFFYLIAGGELLWIPRLLSALFWMVGGIFLYLIAKKIVSPNAAIFSVFFYLFVPYSVLSSRAFMPDPLMVMLLVIAIFTIVRYHEQPHSTRRLIVAAVASSLAVFVKPGICLFQILGAFAALSVYRQGMRRSLLSWQMVVFAVLSVLPTALYYLYGTVGAGFLQGQVQAKLVPEYILATYYWGGWLRCIKVVVGYVALAGALFGVLVCRSGLVRALLLGLWGGYFIFGLVFTYHIHTQDYYSLQLIPVVALSLCPVVELVMKHLRQVGLHSVAGPIIVALSVLVLIVGAVEHRQTISMIAAQDNAATVFARRVAAYKEIGRSANHSQRVLFLTRDEGDYGWPLMYHGRLSGPTWLLPSRSREEPLSTYSKHLEERLDIYSMRLYSYSRTRSLEYFIISRESWKGEDYEDLRTFLTDNLPMIGREDYYVVFDLRIWSQ
jgi:hypothetical protein